MDIVEKLKIINMYYEFTRQKGHTFLTIEARPSNIPCIVIVHNMDSAKRIKKQYNLPNTCHFVSINNLNSLRGYNLPIVFDNAALYSLFGEAIKYITTSKEIIK